MRQGVYGAAALAFLAAVAAVLLWIPDAPKRSQSGVKLGSAANPRSTHGSNKINVQAPDAPAAVTELHSWPIRELTPDRRVALSR
jgi:hypothetical protein